MSEGAGCRAVEDQEKKKWGTTAPFDRLTSVGYQAYLTGCLCVLSRALCAHTGRQIDHETGQRVLASAVNHNSGGRMCKKVNVMYRLGQVAVL